MLIVILGAGWTSSGSGGTVIVVILTITISSKT